MKRNLVKIVTLCAAMALCLSAVLCFSLTASAAEVTVFDGNVSATLTIGADKGVYLNVADVDAALQADYATNGLASNYKVVLTATATSAASCYPIIMGAEGGDVWATREAEGVYAAKTTSTDLTSNIAGTQFSNYPGGAQTPNKIWVYSDEGTTLTVSHVTIIATHDDSVEPTPSEEVSETSEPTTSEDVSETSEPTTSEDVSDASEPTTSEDVSDASEPTTSDDVSEPAEIVCGDADGDGEVTMKDVLAMRKFIAGMEVEIDEAAADVDGDDEITMKDVLAVRKFIAGIIDQLPAIPEETDASEGVSEEISEEVSEEVSEEASEEASEELV